MYSYTELQSRFNRSSNPNKREYKLENNTWVDKIESVSKIKPDDFIITLHGSRIALITQDKIILDSCGYRTMTTKDRLNKILSDNKVGYTIHQKDYKWWLYITVYYPEWGDIKPEVEFYDGITFIYDFNCKLGNGWILNTE